jgi:hypothetical protein
MKRFLLPVLGLASIFFFAVVPTQTTHAAFEAGRIIDDGVFTNQSTMSPSAIQGFLNSKVPSCDTYGTQPSEFGGGTRRQWAENASLHPNIGSIPPPYTCIKDYSEGGRSAAQIIYDKAQQYSINPQVLIVLLQKEQSLITDTWPLSTQYRTATGYGCPDTAPCASQYFGLTNQLDWSAKMFRSIMNASPTWYTPYVLGNNYIQYNPVASCGGSTVNIVNRATQALYNYTPYQPNAAALAAGWGNAQCGAYGNRNFYLYFTSWFGSTTANASYGYSVVSREFYSDAARQNRLADIPVVEPGSTFYAKIVVKNTGNQPWYRDTLRLGGQDPTNRSSDFVADDWINAGRVAAMNEDMVAGGSNATFTFKMKATKDLETRYESFGVLIEGQRWLDGFMTLPITISASGPYWAAEQVSFNVYADSGLTRQLNPAVIDAYTGSKIYIKAVVKNTGNQALPVNQTKFGTSKPLDRSSIYSDGSWESPTRAATLQGANIEPQATGTFTFSMTAPATSQARKLEIFGLVIDGQRWVSDDIGALSIQTNTRPPYELLANQSLELGQSLISYDERFRLIFQGDGNLVLYSPTKPLWSTSTVGKGGVRVVMQNDGNLVMYRSDWTPVWDSSTPGRGPSKLLPQSDGNLVIYTNSLQPTWNTKTNGQQ